MEPTARPIDNIKPCPFCGAQAVLDNLVDVDDYFVRCTSCEVQQIANYLPGHAIERWNKRLRLSDEAVKAAKGEEQHGL